MTRRPQELPFATLPDSIDGPLGDLRFYVGDLDTLVEHIRARRFERGKGIAVCATHLFMEAVRDPGVAWTLRSMSFAICDGQPVAWLMSGRVMWSVPRVSGPDVFARLLDDPGDLRIALVGGTAASLEDIATTLRPGDRHRFLLLDPRRVDQAAVPDPDLIAALARFRPDVVFVGLGCPKQERWVAQACGQVDALFIGVGAAFDYRAGRILRAPPIMQRLSLEWAYRAVQQPKLVSRYLRTGAPFLVLLVRELLAGPLIGVRRRTRSR